MRFQEEKLLRAGVDTEVNNGLCSNSMKIYFELDLEVKKIVQGLKRSSIWTYF